MEFAYFESKQTRINPLLLFYAREVLVILTPIFSFKHPFRCCVKTCVSRLLSGNHLENGEVNVNFTQLE